MRQNNATKAWELYEQGRQYNNSLVPNQYRLVNTNIDFFAGNQWRNIPQTEAMARLPKPVFNIIKRVTSLFVASLTSARFKLQFFPLSDYAGGNVREPEENAAAFATAEVENLLEKFKMEYRVEKQPYILLLGRAPVEQLREEMRRWKAKGEIYADRELKEQAGIGGKTELEGSGEEDGKALYVYLYTKVPVWEPAVDAATGEILQEPVFDKNGDAVLETDEKGNVLLDAFGEPVVKTRDVMRRVERVHVTKATRDAVIFEDVDTGLSRYPIAWGNWERQKNQYHGRALVTGLVPNQIFINMMFAMAMRHLQLMGFPKTVYNADLIGNWSNEIGQAIGVRGLQPGQSISQVAYNLQPADMSNQILTVIDRAIAYTKDCMGATDAQLGNVKPDNTSAIMVLQSNAEVPLENIRAGLHEWIEDIGAILLDMMGAYYGERPVVREKELEEPVIGADGNPVIGADGRMETQKVVRRVMEPFDFGVIPHLWLRVRADVGAASQYSDISTNHTRDNLRSAGELDIVQYLERVPERLIPRKQELIEALKKQESGTAKTGGQGAEQMLGAMSGNTQTRYHAMPRASRSALQRQTAMRSR